MLMMRVRELATGLVLAPLDRIAVETYLDARHAMIGAAAVPMISGALIALRSCITRRTARARR